MDLISNILKAYDQKSFVTKLKARFILYSYCIVLVSLFIIVLYTLYGNLNNPLFDYSVNFLLIGLYLAGFVFFFLGLFLLFRGHFTFSAHLLLVCGLSLAWINIFVNETYIIARLDTIVLVVALLSMLPIVISRKPVGMLFYAGANIVILFIFMYNFHTDLDLPKASLISYFFDNTVAIMAVAMFSYVGFFINKRAMDKAELDFAERIKAEEALKNSEQFKMRVFDNSRIPIVVINPLSFQYIEFNQAAIDIYGFPSREALLGKTPADVSASVQYDGTPSFEKAMVYVNKALTEGSVVFEWKHLRPNGEYWDAEVHLLSFKVNEQNFLQFSMIDISERKEFEIALMHSEEKYRTLMESLNDVVMMVDNDDRVLFVNKKFTEKLGYEASEIIGKIGYQCLVSPENQNIIISSNYNRLKKNKSQYEMPFIAKDGTIIDFLVSGAPIVNSEGKTIGSIGAMIDITDRKKIENALRESEEKFRLLAENIPGIIYLCQNDQRWSMLFLNDEVEKITGYSKHDFLNHSLSFADIYHPDDLEIITYKAAKALEERRPFHIQYRIKHKNNFWRWLEEYGVGIERNGKIELLEGFITDITDKKNTELELMAYRDDLEQLVSERTDELAVTNEELQVSNSDLMQQREDLEVTLADLKTTQDQLVQAEKMASLGILTAGVAHEINNPLNYVYNGTAAIESIIRDHYDQTDDLNPLFEAVSAGVKRISGIVKSMSRYSRNENMPFTSCNIQEVIDDCLILLHNKYKNKIEIKKNYLPEPPVYFANEGQLHQAFLNVLANAIQAIEKDGTVTIDVVLNTQQLLISITDNGKGISKEHLNRIFDPFFTTKYPGEGTGLGLAITKKIIEEHRGTIYCKSTPGKGTTFSISFPLNNQKP